MCHVTSCLCIASDAAHCQRVQAWRVASPFTGASRTNTAEHLTAAHHAEACMMSWCDHSRSAAHKILGYSKLARGTLIATTFAAPQQQRLPSVSRQPCRIEILTPASWSTTCSTYAGMHHTTMPSDLARASRAILSMRAVDVCGHIIRVAYRFSCRVCQILTVRSLTNPKLSACSLYTVTVKRSVHHKLFLPCRAYCSGA